MMPMTRTRIGMRRELLAVALMLIGLSSAVASETEEALRQSRQAELDRACEAAR
jgi:VIT1/CCC1 family predicted Fe2+/Mn2+ transporter